MIAHGVDDDPFGQMTLGQCLAVERIVDHEIEAGAQVGHVAVEGLVGVDGNLQPTEVHAIVGRKEALHVGVLVPLHLLRRESLGLEVGEGLVAHGVHRLRGVTEDGSPCLLVKVDVLLLATHLLLL